MENMKNMIGVSILDILKPSIKSKSNENVYKMIDIIKDKTDVYLELFSVAIFHQNFEIVKMLYEKFHIMDNETPYINALSFYNSILPENSKYKLTDQKENYIDIFCPFGLMAAIGGDIEIFKYLYTNNLIPDINIQGNIGLSKKSKNIFSSNLIGACCYYGKSNLLEYLLKNYKKDLDINFNTTEKKSKKGRATFNKEYSDFSPCLLAATGQCSDEETLKVLKILENYKVNFEKKDFNDENIIHIATRNKKIKSVKFLIECIGLKNMVNDTNKDGMTPFTIAKKVNCEQLVNFFNNNNQLDEKQIEQNLNELIQESNTLKEKRNKNKKKGKKKKDDTPIFFNASEYEESLKVDKNDDDVKNNNNNTNKLKEMFGIVDPKKNKKEEIEENNDNEEEEEEKEKYKNEENEEWDDNYEDDENDDNYNNEKYSEQRNTYSKYNNNYSKGNSNTTRYYNKKSSYKNTNYQSQRSYYSNNNYNNNYNNSYNNNYNNNNYNSYNKSNYYNRNDNRRNRYYNNNNNNNNNTNNNNNNNNEENEKKTVVVEVNDENNNNKNESENLEKENKLRAKKEVETDLNENKSNNNNDNDNEELMRKISSPKSKELQERMESFKSEIKQEIKHEDKNKNNLEKNENIKDGNKNLEEEVEEESDEGDEDFLNYSEQDKSKNEDLKNVSSNEYNELHKKFLDIERKCNILQKEKEELNSYVKKLYMSIKINTKNIPNNENNINNLLLLANQELEDKNERIKELKEKTAMADLSDAINFSKEDLKNYKDFYTKNLKIITDAIKGYNK